MRVAIDFETSGLDFWSPDFQVLSMAQVYKNPVGKLVREMYYGAENCRRVVSDHIKNKNDLIVYNAGFEDGVIRHALKLDTSIYCDVMRLVQVFGSPNRVPMSLKYSTTRFLPEYSHYERPIKEWIHANYKVGGGKWGQYIQYAPKELLEDYNLMDAEVTYRLYELLVSKFKVEKYDWTNDHKQYIYMARQIVDAQARGIHLDLNHLNRSAGELTEEIETVKRDFLTKHAEGVAVVRKLLKDRAQAKYKKKIVTELPEFNVQSKKHLELLFCGYYEQVPPRRTKKGSPSFKKAHLGLWEGAEGLVTLGGRMQAMSQVAAVLTKQTDGVIHIGLKTVGTITGRFAGTGGLNIQALARKSKQLMRGFVAKPGYIFVSSDGAAMEPTITAVASGDKNYRYATYEGLGKSPFYKDDVLFIDDVYLMVLSVLPFGKLKIKEMFNNSIYKAPWSEYDIEGNLINGYTFSEAWVADRDLILTPIKPLRQIAKLICLGLGYGLQKTNLAKNLNENKFKCTEEMAANIYHTYWRLFHGIRKLSDHMSYEADKYGFIINPFGFRMTPEPRKAFNALIQSSVNGVIALYLQSVLSICDWAEYVTIIHDEILFQIPENKVDEFRSVVALATDNVNAVLEWDIKLRFGFVPGKTLYDAK